MQIEDILRARNEAYISHARAAILEGQIGSLNYAASVLRETRDGFIDGARGCGAEPMDDETPEEAEQRQIQYKKYMARGGIFIAEFHIACLNYAIGVLEDALYDAEKECMAERKRYEEAVKKLSGAD